MDKINIREKLDHFDELWSPRIIGEVNDSYVKIAKFKGEFIWHVHQEEDEMFYVLKGTLTIRFRDKAVVLRENECIVIPRGIEHIPVADEEVHVMLIESKTTLNTGNVKNDRTVEKLEKI